MSIEQVGLQLGLAGLMLVVFYRLALVWIDRNGKAEDKRTDTIADGFKTLTSAMQIHHDADLASHADMREDLAHLTAKLDTAFDLTPTPRTPRTNPHGVPVGEYGLRRPRTRGEGG